MSIADAMSLQPGQVIRFLEYRENSKPQFWKSEPYTVLQAWSGTEKEKLVDCDRLYNLRSQIGNKYIYKASRQAKDKDTIQLNAYNKTTPYVFSKPYHVLFVREVPHSQRFSSEKISKLIGREIL